METVFCFAFFHSADILRRAYFSEYTDMIVPGQVFENEHFHITLTPPGCKAVIDNAIENTCACLANAQRMRDQGKRLLQDTDGKIRFINCGKGKITLTVLTNDKKKMDWDYYASNYEHLLLLIKEVLVKTDQFHIKKGNLWQALHPTEDAHILELHRGVPKHLGEKHFPQYYDTE